jgi:hypothetical protein
MAKWHPNKPQNLLLKKLNNGNKNREQGTGNREQEIGNPPGYATPLFKGGRGDQNLTTQTQIKSSITF